MKLMTRASSLCQQLVVPEYEYPTSGPMWSDSIGTHPPPIMILDVDSGNSTAPDSTYQATVAQAKAAGAEILGYVDTSYASKATATVETDATNYKTWYGVTNIFFDNVSSDISTLSYYQTLDNYVHTTNPGSLVMLNPGDFPPEQFMTAGDVLMVFENSYANYVNAQIPSWVYNYPSTRFVNTIYAASASQWQNALSLSQSRNAGDVYITDDTDDAGNPYDSLPSYWSSLNAAIASACGGPTPTLTPTLAPTPTPTPGPKTGDINGDGSINIFDLSILLSHWATSNATSDLNHDGTVNIYDLSILLSHWGT